MMMTTPVTLTSEAEEVNVQTGSVIQTKPKEGNVLLLPLWTSCNKPTTISFHLTKCSFTGNFIVAALLNEERRGRNKEQDGRLCFALAGPGDALHARP